MEKIFSIYNQKVIFHIYKPKISCFTKFLIRNVMSSDFTLEIGNLGQMVYKTWLELQFT